MHIKVSPPGESAVHQAEQTKLENADLIYDETRGNDNTTNISQYITQYLAHHIGHRDPNHDVR